MQPDGERACLRTPRCNSTQYEISARIAVLNELPAQQLRDEWRRLRRGQPPRLSRDYRVPDAGACLRRFEQG
jgi:hypothetical protein